MSDPLIGKDIGGCKVLKKLGEGGMGWAYQAHHTRLDRNVVLKILLPELAKDPEQAQAFLREAQAAARMEHPRVVQVYDQGSAGDLHYIIMQFIDGETLEDAMQREGAMPSIRAIAIIKAALEGLREAHNHGIVHRDVKPSNILMGKDGSIRLSDFGLALTMQKGKAKDSKVIGTPLYMSPEQIWGADMDGRSDIYSMGATLFHMVAGRPPYEAPSPTDIVSMHVNNPPPDIRQVTGGVSKALAELLLKMMAKKPEERPAGVDEVLTALASPAMVLESASVEGEQMIDLGVNVQRRRTQPGADLTPPASAPRDDFGPPPTPPPTAPGDAHGSRRPLTEPRILADSKLTPWRPLLGAMLWLSAGLCAYGAGAGGRLVFAAGAMLLAAAAAVIAPASLRGPLVPLLLGGGLSYAAGGGLGAAFAAPDKQLLCGSLGALLSAVCLALTGQLYRGPLLRVVYLLAAAAAAALLLLFAVPGGLGFEVLQGAQRHPHAFVYLGGAAAAHVLAVAVCGTRPHWIMASLLVGAGTLAAYAAGAVHYQTVEPPAESGVIAQARAAARDGERRQRDVMVVIEDGETVVKEAPEDEGDPAPDAGSVGERPNLADALKRPFDGWRERSAKSRPLAPLGLGLVMLGAFLVWRNGQRN